MLSDGASLLTDGAEDVNDAGLVDNGTSPAAPFAFNGSFSSTGGGRFQVSLTNYVGRNHVCRVSFCRVASDAAS